MTSDLPILFYNFILPVRILSYNEIHHFGRRAIVASSFREKRASGPFLQTASTEYTIPYFSLKPTMMNEQLQMIAPLTPPPRRKVESIDSMISQIDTETRLRREGEKRSYLKRADHTPPSLVDESHQTAKRRCVSFDFSVVSDDESEETSKITFRQHWRRAPLEGLSFALRPRKLNRELNTSKDFAREVSTLRPRNVNRELNTCEEFAKEVNRITDDLPFMPF
jgi:hypothetical protein